MFITDNRNCFACGERNNWQNIKKSQNIMKLVETQIRGQILTESN